MYLRPGSLFHQFVVERKTLKTSDNGRPQAVFLPTFSIVRGALADAKTSEILRWKALQHPVTHTIVQHYGEPVAKPGDRLVHNNRYFYVRGVDNASMLGMFTIYYVEERSDRVE